MIFFFKRFFFRWRFLLGNGKRPLEFVKAAAAAIIGEFWVTLAIFGWQVGQSVNWQHLRSFCSILILKCTLCDCFTCIFAHWVRILKMYLNVLFHLLFLKNWNLSLQKLGALGFDCNWWILELGVRVRLNGKDSKLDFPKCAACHFLELI